MSQASESMAYSQEKLHELGVPKETVRFCGVQSSHIKSGGYPGDGGQMRRCSWLRSATVGMMVVYPPDRKLPHDKWDTHGEMLVMCGNCEFVKDNRLRVNGVTQIYRCMGHHD